VPIPVPVPGVGGTVEGPGPDAELPGEDGEPAVDAEGAGGLPDTVMVWMASTGRSVKVWTAV
jgi:hypothetical protein